MKETYPTVIITPLGTSAPCKYDVSLQGRRLNDMDTIDIEPGTYNTIEEVLACLDGLPERFLESIRAKLRGCQKAEFNIREAYE